MAKLGTEKNPAIIRVKTKRRGEELLAMCNSRDWQVIVGIEPDKPEDISDVERLLNTPKPAVNAITTGRNDPCPCGSGNKYKHCCMR